MNFFKYLRFIFLFILSIVILFCQIDESFAFSYQQNIEISRIRDLVTEDTDLVTEDTELLLKLLGKSFNEIIQVLGEPVEQGYSEWFGPNYYILFRHKDGVILFSSPEMIENKIAVSILIGEGQYILGTKVGMLFSDIKEILGPPDFGPELSMDNQYYMDYFFEDIGDGMSQVLISFISEDINSPTQEAFVKWEGFAYDQIKVNDVISGECLPAPDLDMEPVDSAV